MKALEKSPASAIKRSDIRPPLRHAEHGGAVRTCFDRPREDCEADSHGFQVVLQRQIARHGIRRVKSQPRATEQIERQAGCSRFGRQRSRPAARRSRHQYGDAADIAIDANGDGRFTEVDSRLVGLAVEIVELRYPELAGGLGLYLDSNTPFVHIDARGKRVRWRG
jgi:hypothetical protein